MTWHPPNTTSGENNDEISRRQKEIVSQQIDEWMISFGCNKKWDRNGASNG